jgi:hypothetical protein
MRQKINVGAALTLRAVLPARAFILNSLKTSRMRYRLPDFHSMPKNRSLVL